jgi:hypothetical protein
MRHTFCKRTFLNPISTLSTSYIFAYVADSQDGAANHLGNMLIIADCHRIVEFEFYLGTRMHRRLSVAKLNHLIDTLTGFRAALVKEIELIENFKKSK